MNNVRMDYYSASWCGPCKFVKPIVYELQAAGWNIQMIDADIQKDKVTENKIAGIPTFIIYRDGIQVNRITGARAKSELLIALNNAAS